LLANIKACQAAQTVFGGLDPSKEVNEKYRMTYADMKIKLDKLAEIESTKINCEKGLLNDLDVIN